MMAVDSGLLSTHNNNKNSSSSSSSSSSNSSSTNSIDECPLCLEILDIDDKSFYPCTCGYQICRFCWHRILSESSDESSNCCPACRKPYTENPANFKPLSVEDVQLKIKQQKRQKDLIKKQKTVDSRRHLSDLRVVQKNLVFVVGITPRIADPELLKKNEYFGKFGKIHKIVVNNVAVCNSGGGNSGVPPPPSPSAYGAYITYNRSEDALRAIQSVNNIPFDGKTIKASLGTTKYCSHFMRNQSCPKPECMYLHHHGDPEASFTKEDMQMGKHQEYEKKLIEEFNAVANSNGKINNNNSKIKEKEIKNGKNVVIAATEKTPPEQPIIESPRTPPSPETVSPSQPSPEPEPLPTVITEQLPRSPSPQQPQERPETPLLLNIPEIDSSDPFDPFYETQKAFEKLVNEELLASASSTNNGQNSTGGNYSSKFFNNHPPGFSHPWQPTPPQQQSSSRSSSNDDNWMNLDPAIIFSAPNNAEQELIDERHLLGNNLLDVFNYQHNQHIQQRPPAPQHSAPPGPPPPPPHHHNYQNNHRGNNYVINNSPLSLFANHHHHPFHHLLHHSNGGGSQNYSPPPPPPPGQGQGGQGQGQGHKLMTSPPPGFSQQPYQPNNNNNNYFNNYQQFPF